MAQPDQPKQRRAPLDIDQSVRERAEAAARRAGMSLNDWLNSTLDSPPAPGLADQYATLSPRERQIVALLAEGKSNKEIGAQIGLAEATVKVHRAAAMRKMQAPNVTHLIVMAEKAQIHEHSGRLRHITDLLGGPKVVGKYPADPLAAHEMLERGLPNTAIKHLLDGMTTLSQKSLEGAIGMSERTRQRREKHPAELLSQDQAGRTWKFAEILTRAISAFGSRTAAEQWLAQPATGLEQRRPIDLLTTPAGVELVEDFLGRIEYGVYT